MVAGRKLNALVNTGASNLFMLEELARKLSLKIKNEPGRIKTVNSKSISLKGVAKGVDLQLGDWTGKASIKVIPLDNYDFVVGLSFLDRVNASIVPSSNFVVISDSNYHCMPYSARYCTALFPAVDTVKFEMIKARRRVSEGGRGSCERYNFVILEI
ncbi:hypothetical protein GOBAR_AA37090 [Gossypium barbadense]|uniref:Aspartic peptidase DDI1-type domain-containing protein n=1 Tax=Gossypium barbadense TaxID=3634 RepID=A0A2P5VXQ4_GOSBA|nr:hypothetical protein GOBAR_AA37090 [Gossypium barbadense]